MTAKYVYPWMAGDVDAPKMVKSEILQEMRSRYPGVENMAVPDPRVLKALNSLMADFQMLVSTEKVPWIVCVSSSTPLLQTLARLVPCTLMLSWKLKPMNITTDLLVDLFKQPTPFDDFAPDPTGELIHSIKNRGIVVWENFCELKLGGFKHASQFMSLLGYRMEWKKATLFLCSYPQALTPAAVTALKQQIEKSVGPSIPSMLTEVALWRNFKVAAPKLRIETEEV